MTKTDDVRIGKFISLVLRHHPEAAGVTLDAHGYADTEKLIAGVGKRFDGFDMNDLERIVRNNNKQRYAFNEDKTKIRANQGHSVDGIDMGYKPVVPPDTLYHGTDIMTAEIIRTDGIRKMSRQYVHLSPDEKTAEAVGKRHGKPFVFTVDSAAMHRDGYVFFRSENGVWLTEYVPANYIYYKKRNE